MEFLLREEIEQRGITMETLQHIFPLYQVHPSPAAPALAQGSPSSLALGTPLMPGSPGEDHMVIDLLDTPDIVVASYDDEGH